MGKLLRHQTPNKLFNGVMQVFPYFSDAVAAGACTTTTWGASDLLLKQQHLQQRQMHAMIPAKSKINAIAIPAVGPGATLQQSASLFAKHTSTDPESPQPLKEIVHQRSLSFSRKTRSAQFPSYGSIPPASAIVHPQPSLIEKITPG
ncbi:unnamed protein product [Bathycoccus prasinos]